MKRLASTSWLALLSSAWLGACAGSANNGGYDGGFMRTDAALALDAAPSDAAYGSWWDAAPRDGAVLPPNLGCTSESLEGSCAAPVDIDARGAVVNGVTFVVGQNCASPAALPSALPAASCAQGATHAVVFGYTMHATARLVVSTLESDKNFDDVVWVLEGCGASATELACNDDAAPASGEVRARAVTSQTVARGTRVRIVVAGNARAAGDASADGGASATGTMVLALREVVPNAGASCSVDNPYCQDGESCVLTAGADGGAGRCVLDGTAGAACRLAPPACSGVDAASRPLACTAVTPTRANSGVCLGLGAPGGRCRTSMPACDQGACETSTGLCPAG